MYDALHIDFETRSVTDLKKSGVYRYAEDPTTAPWGFAYRFGERGEVYEWRPGYPDPVAVLQHVAEGGRVVAHNAAFERTIWNIVLIPRYCPHWPPLRIEQQDCTMARSAALALPQKLDMLGTALKLNFRKDSAGHRLMLKMMKPRSFNADGTITWWDAPEDIDKLMAYAQQDVRTETNADQVLAPLTPTWRKVWELDQRINERGVRFDMPTVRRAEELVRYAKKQNDYVMRVLTKRAVSKCTNDKKIIAWLNEKGIPCTSLKKGDFDDVLFLASLEHDKTAHDVVRLRKAGWKTSTAKYAAMEQCVSYDDRIRFLINFHAASTGRFGGRLVQPQNFPRVDPDDELLAVKIEWLHELLARTDLDIRAVYDHIEAVYGPLECTELLSKALRSMIVAAPGKKLIGGDFSNIEGRVNAWLAGEQWKLEAFEAFDAKTGPDLYKLAYAKSFGVPVETIGKGQKRQIGKVQELALGYQGGIGAYLTMGATYGVNPYELSTPVQEATPIEQWDATLERYNRRGTNRFSLYAREWAALQILVDNWRAAHPCIVQSWWDVQDAAIEAVSAPGSIVAVGRIQYYSDQRHLWCVLPSGRMLCYAEPEVINERKEYIDKNGETKERWNRRVTFWAQDSLTKQWTLQGLYGGLQWENIVQAVACDILVDAMIRVEDAGYPVVLTVHDEIVAEPDINSGLTDKAFEQIMAVKPEWAAGLPNAVSAWEDVRYVK